MTHFRLGVVPYVNAMPLWVPLERNLVTTQHSFTFERAVPDRLARDLAAGQVDCAIVSIVEALKNRRLKVIDGVCIASRGPVETVQLFHRRPLAECTKILLDRDSRTSALLARLLLEKVHPRPNRQYDTGRVDPAQMHSTVAPAEANGVTSMPPLERADLVDRGAAAPTPTEFAGGPARVAAAPGGRLASVGRGLVHNANLNDYEAFLSIGDKTWTFLKSDWDRTDLGALWTTTTGLPMVWAAWTCTEAIALGDLPEVLVRARDSGLTIFDDIIRRLSRSSQADQIAILRYLSDVMHYKLGHEEKAGIQALFEMGHEQGILPPVRRVAYQA